uniref:Uncharacterized protein n=1 Tax=Sipha flava TaxID=143950 RepID=A0A2S2RAZ3_9HEMI
MFFYFLFRSMESFIERMRKQTAIVRKSVGDLIIDHNYKIINLYVAQTKFGRSVKAIMEETESERVEVFLPKSVSISDEEIDDYNDDDDDRTNKKKNALRLFR